MQKLNLPEYKLKLRKENSKPFVFDIFRKKYVSLTPEEWVRQQFAQYLINVLDYPPNLITTEYSLKINLLSKRCDIVAFNRKGEPVVIVECKSPTVNITQDVFDQIATYNMKLNVKILIVTNGLKHYCCIADKNNNSYTFLEDIPKYKTVCEQVS